MISLFWVLMLLVGCQQPPASPNDPVPTGVVSPTPNLNDGVVELSFPAFEDGSEAYYFELLQTALAENGSPLQSLHLQLIDPLPQKRAVQMFEQDNLHIMYLIQTAERDQQYIPIEVGLTNGLIGQRLLLIRPEDSDTYAQVKTLADFQKLNKTAALGKNWFDVQVWAYNQLPVVEIDGEWRKIYAMLARGDRNIDYFSRGFTEIVVEANEHPELAIEPHLMLTYERDFRFYLSPSAASHKQTIEQALRQAQTNGLMDTLIRRYWADDFAQLATEQRVNILLATPE